MIFSAKISNLYAEVMMSYVGSDIFDKFEIYQSLEDSMLHNCFDNKKISKMGMQIVS